MWLDGQPPAKRGRTRRPKPVVAVSPRPEEKVKAARARRPPETMGSGEGAAPVRAKRARSFVQDLQSMFESNYSGGSVHVLLSCALSLAQC